ncbi:MAG: hypothetical protein JM58_03440 [Peptococcaceae bacterium BICA1-8]|nr:MAG: hypothetical protein JM58_03440 [Peptococcaceae bacterium BICA1-8]
MRMWKAIYIVMFIFTLTYPIVAYANSSWHWVTYSPKKILPYAVIITLLIETVGIKTLGKINNWSKTLAVVTLANMMSFIFPYFERALRHRATAGEFIWAWKSAFDSGPYYMIMLGYLLLTLVFEIPIVYYFLKKYAKNTRNLLYTIVSVNIITTLCVFIMERIISQGQWRKETMLCFSWSKGGLS